jgi:hypothetical protein
MAQRSTFEQHLLALLRHRPIVHLPSVIHLLALCEQQLREETQPGWVTFWSLAWRYFKGLQTAPERPFSTIAASAASQVLSGLLLRQQFDKEPSAERLEVVNHLLFLDQADVITQRLLNTLEECAEGQELTLPPEVQADAQSMAELASDVSLSGVQQVADALASHVARLRTSRVVSDITTSLQGAQEVSRLLHQFAVGNEHVPQDNVLAALRTDV